MQDVLSLYDAMLKDMALKCGVEYDARDYDTIARRLRSEGKYFLTTVLPSLSKGLERALERGHLDSNDIPWFRRTKRSGNYPAFLQVYFRQVFHEDGFIRMDESAADSVLAIRQVANFYKKLKEVCSERQKEKSFNNYVSCEAELVSATIHPDDVATFCEVSRIIWSNCFSDFDCFNLIPQHGPGATAEKRNGNSKYVHKQWNESLEPYFPYHHNAVPNENWHDIINDEDVKFVSGDNFDPVRVIAVPKTAEKARIIAIEPVCMQYAQQGVKDYLYTAIDTFKLTKGHINFTDQSVNATIALQSSLTREYATIDLSDASDRVTLSAIMTMLKDVPDLLDVLLATRSRRADVQGKVITLNKFASMGSAVCFPIEAMYFFTLCVVGILRDHKLEPTYRNIEKCCEKIYVYGDDIAVPRLSAPIVCETLQRNTCKVNEGKTFMEGFFRESCGTDAYMGFDVTPIYMRQPVPRRRYSANWESFASTANQFYNNGWWLTATAFDVLAERLRGKKFPLGTSESQFLCRVVFAEHKILPSRLYKRRWNRDLQRYEIQVPTVSQKYKSDQLQGHGALMKFFLRKEKTKSTDTSVLASILPDEGTSTKLVKSELIRLGRGEYIEGEEFNYLLPSHLCRTVRKGHATLKTKWCADPSQRRVA